MRPGSPRAVGIVQRALPPTGKALWGSQVHEAGHGSPWARGPAGQQLQASFRGQDTPPATPLCDISPSLHQHGGGRGNGTIGAGRLPCPHAAVSDVGSTCCCYCPSLGSRLCLGQAVSPSPGVSREPHVWSRGPSLRMEHTRITLFRPPTPCHRLPQTSFCLCQLPALVCFLEEERNVSFAHGPRPVQAAAPPGL